MGYDEFDGFDFEDNGNASGGLAEVRRAYNALKKKYSELETAHTTLVSKNAQQSLTKVLADKGLRPGLAKVIAKEDLDLSDPKAIEAWLSDPANQEDHAFSITAAPAAEAGSEGADGGNDEYAATLAAIQGASNGALPDAKFQQAEDLIKKAGSQEEIQAALSAALKNLG